MPLIPEVQRIYWNIDCTIFHIENFKPLSFGQTKTCLRFLNIPDRVSAEIWYLKWYQKGYENIHYEAFNMFQVEYLRERWNEINYRLCSNGSDKGSKILRIFPLRTSADGILQVWDPFLDFICWCNNVRSYTNSCPPGRFWGRFERYKDLKFKTSITLVAIYYH